MKTTTPVLLLLSVVLTALGCSRSSTPDACAASQLTPTLTGLGGAASQSIWQLAVRNVSHSTCLIEGYLAVDAQDERHQNLDSAQLGRPTDQRLIRLRPGMTAYGRISFAYLDPRTDQLCGPAAAWLRVGLPDDKGTLDIDVGPPPGPGQESVTFSPCGGFVIGPIQLDAVTG